MEEQSGWVYLFHNPQTGEGYIGSTDDLKRRTQAHLRDLERGTHHCWKFQRSYNKNPNFDLVAVSVESKEEALSFEGCLLQEYGDNPFLLNVSKDAYAPMTGRNHSPETRERMREIQLQQWQDPEIRRKRIKNRDMFTHTPESKEKIRQAALGRKASEEVRAKMKQSQQKLWSDPAFREKHKNGLKAHRERQHSFLSQSHITNLGCSTSRIQIIG